MMFAKMAFGLALIVGTQSSPRGGYMQAAEYRVGSWVTKKQMGPRDKIYTNYSRSLTEIGKVPYAHGALTVVCHKNKVFVVNDGRIVQSFYAQEAKLYLILEARRGEKWIPIEYLQRSRVSSDYHMVRLDPGQFWELPGPKGDKDGVETLCRYRLMDAKSNTFSNSFKVKLSPTRFELDPLMKERYAVNENGILYEAITTNDLLGGLGKF